MSTGFQGDVQSGQGRTRWSLFAFALLFVLLAIVVQAPASPGAPSHVKVAKASQAGKSMILQVRTDRQVALDKLHGFPTVGRRKAKYLCAEFERKGREGISRVCLGGKRSHHVVSVSRVRKSGKVVSKDTIAAHVKRSGKRKLVVKFDPSEARLSPAAYSWRVIYSSGSCPVSVEDCESDLPSKGFYTYRVLPVVPVGCTSGGTRLYTSGSTRHKRVALTFADGPSLYPGDILRILADTRVTATFFELGSEVDRYPDKTRAVLAAGHELANHSTNHASFPSASDIAHTSHIIKSVSGYRTCDFRPPGGAVDSTVISSAGASGMSTVNWDVDTRDWQLPGSSAITSRILGGVHPGAIVLMHDGGGPRGGTVDSLRATIHGLKKRGYEFVTVSDILGGRTLYRPAR